MAKDEKKNKHNDVVKKIKKEFEGTFLVSDKENNLPKFPELTRKRSVYRPDLIFREGGEITHIIEVETSGAGKSVVGAAILADYCIGEHLKHGEQKSKPYLVFVFLGQKPRLQLAQKRIKTIQEDYLRNLRRVLIFREDEAIEKIRESRTEERKSGKGN